VEQIEITSTDLVKTLVALEGRPWAEMGRNRKPLTQNRLARMLKPLGIGPKNVGPKDARVRGYILADFKEVFERYLAPEGASQPPIRPQAHEIRTSDIFQPHTTDNGCADVKREKPNNDGLVGGCAVAKGGNGQNVRPPSGEEPGLSLRTIRDLADEYRDQTYAEYQRNGGADVDHRPLDAWLRHRLREMVLPEHIELEFERVMEAVFAI
jgi:hypothetical protein